MSAARAKPKCPVVDFDHHSEEYARTQDRFLEQLRTECPVAFTDNYESFYVVTGFPEVRQVLLDDDGFSVEPGEDGKGGLLIPPSSHKRAALIPGEIDPPQHGVYRRAVAPLFSKVAAERLDGLTENIVSACLDGMLEAEEFDFVSDLTTVVPAALILAWLGFPEEERAEFKTAVDVTFGIGRAPATDTTDHVSWLRERVSREIADRRRAPRDDGISDLLRVNDGAFTDADIHGYVMNLLAGGIPTTSGFTANAFLHLHRDHELRRRLAGDSSLLPGAVDELLRVYSPAVALARTVTRPVEVGGVPFETGDRVLVVLPSSNMDARQFVNPDVIDIDRRGLHLAFGAGAHYCVGVHIARVEARVILRCTLERMPDYWIDEARSVRMARVGLLNGWATMPARPSPPTSNGGIPG